jgi:hypothetical protein
MLAVCLYFTSWLRLVAGLAYAMMTAAGTQLHRFCLPTLSSQQKKASSCYNRSTPALPHARLVLQNLAGLLLAVFMQGRKCQGSHGGRNTQGTQTAIINTPAV